MRFDSFRGKKLVKPKFFFTIFLVEKEKNRSCVLTQINAAVSSISLKNISVPSKKLGRFEHLRVSLLNKLLQNYLLGQYRKTQMKTYFPGNYNFSYKQFKVPWPEKNHNADRMGLTINMFPLDNRFILGINVIGLFQSSKMPRANTAWGISKCLEVAIHLNYTCLKLVAKFLNGTSEYNIDYLTVHVT